MIRPLLATLLVAALLAACAKKQPPPAPGFVPADAQTLSRLQGLYQQSDSSARVGLVSSVLEKENIVAVAQVNPSEWRQGDIVTFVDSANRTLGTGEVVRAVGNEVHVQFDQAAPGGRLPRAGDLAVRFRL